ncbi:NFACT RNA binding domain-containing protein [Chryseolinea sp. T2]|uniref:NFACT RNA binding domain-containing protein n=1 Tax=Chryseolinea sp. T2 TaxID=3129255 RepID=UPI0030768C06
MQNNFHFLQHQTRYLSAILRDAVVSECYSQEKAELIVRFETHQGSFHLRANLSPAFTCVSFPKNFQRARKNSVDLFQGLTGNRVTGIVQHQYDRSFTIHFVHDTLLLFKLHGNRSNIISYADGQQEEMFRTNLVADQTIHPDQLDRSMDTGYNAFIQNQDRLSSLYFTFGKIPWTYLSEQGFNGLDTGARWDAIKKVFALLEQPAYYITLLDGKVSFSLLPVGEIQQEYNDPIMSVTEFSQRFRSREGFDQEYGRTETWLRKKLSLASDAWQRARARLSSLETYDKFKVWADLIMANLHVTNDGDRIVLPNFYNDNKPEEIRLQRDLPMQRNAAIYYAKSKKQQIEIRHLETLITQKQQELDSLQKDLTLLSTTQDLKVVRSVAVRHPVRSGAEESETAPFHETDFMGFRILIGKNAQTNDTLLQQYAYKDDLWLHAKDVTGSHVLIKHQAGKVIPKPVIERAAQLAAWYSKRKTDTLCPVSVTPRKYVRKRKGDPAGAVVVERETVLMVEPVGLN